MPPKTVELATPIAAEPVGAVHAAGVLAGDEQAESLVVVSTSQITPPMK